MQRMPLPDPLPQDIEVWRLDLNVTAPIANTDWAVLTEEEGMRALRYRRHEDKVRFVAVRAALRRLLATRLCRRPESLRFAMTLHGKPQLSPQSVGANYEFSVSHSGDFALIALSKNSAVGVDIERRDAAINAGCMEALVLSPVERQIDATRRPDFFECWTAKEAALKALGVGIAECLDRLSILRPERQSSLCYDVRYAVTEWPMLHAWRLDAPVGYAAALARVREWARDANE